jgi:two-component sensor histidine kinase
LRKLWHEGFVPGSPAAYLAAVACVGVATLLRFALGLLSDDILPLATYFPAVLLAALLGGVSSGALALILGGSIGWWAFMPKHHIFVVPTLSDVISLTLYAGSAGIIICIAEGYRRAMRHVREEEAKRALLMSELQHRSMNTMAVVQSIVSQSLRANREEAEKINGRIQALAATNDLLTASADQLTDFNSILLAEFKPYATRRIVLDGARMNLSGDLAKPLALVVHELATNAAKYGSLSVPNGVLSVRWNVVGGRAEVSWEEQGGPPVVPPTKQGFGTQFITQVLKTLQGAATTEFRTGGVQCTISFLVSEPTHRPSVERSNHQQIAPGTDRRRSATESLQSALQERSLISSADSPIRSFE